MSEKVVGNLIIIGGAEDKVGHKEILNKVVSYINKEKDMIFIRLVYLCELHDDINNITLQKEEYSEYKLIESLDDLKGKLIAPFLEDLFESEL